MANKNWVGLFIAVLFVVHIADVKAGDMPAEVSDFVERRELCDHFRGEMTGDESERGKAVNRELEHYCKGSDGKLIYLRNKYKDRQEVLQALSKYEDCIEGNCKK